MLYFVFMYRFFASRYRKYNDLKDPRVSPLFYTSFAGLPPYLFIIADLDPLRDGNLGICDFSEYQKLLEKADVQTKLAPIFRS
jgi:acetyl esterase/lipase